MTGKLITAFTDATAVTSDDRLLGLDGSTTKLFPVDSFAQIGGAAQTGHIALTDADDANHIANFEQTSATATALRLRQSGAGPIAKWRQGATDRGFIQNGGGFKLLPASDGRAVEIASPSWSGGRAFSYGTANRDGLVIIEDFVDASGSASPLTYTKGFGLTGSKTGAGNLDAFWSSLTHSGAGEVGLFIGDATTTAGGNAWGVHAVVTSETVDANLYGQRTELYKNVAGTGKTQVGFWLRSLGSSACTVGMQIGGSGGWTDYLVCRNTADTAIFSIRGSDGQVSTRNIATAGSITASVNGATPGTVTGTTNADGQQVLRMETDRPWAFRQVGTAGSTVLRLSPDATTKTFRITAPAGNRTFETQVDDTVGSSYAWIMPEAGGKVGFFGATPIVKPAVTGSRGGNAALASLLTQLSSLGILTDSSTA